MNEEEAKRLLLKYRQGGLSEPELEQLLGWVQQYRADRPVSFTEAELENAQDLMWLAINRASLAIKQVKLWPGIAAAAMLLLMAGLAMLLYTGKFNEGPELQTAVIVPGTNKALLLLAGGKRIPLSGEKAGLVVAGNELYYNDGSQVPGAPGMGGAGMNALQVPKGGQYRAVLPDGTRIWLNAASSVKFPSRFSGANRTVELRGEGYFEVAADPAHPFIVKTERQEVKVLGTHFNINAYADEPVVATTLTEGAVLVSTALGNMRLKPAQQSLLSVSGIRVVPADVTEALAWKNGEFVFNEESLESILRKVSRWYDVEIVFRDESKRKVLFAGSIARFSELSVLLEMLQRTKLAAFRLEGRKLIVL